MIISEYLPISSVASGTATDFDFDFKIQKTTDLEVFADSELVDSLEYTVAIDTENEGGVVTFITEPTEGTVIRLDRVTPIDQQTDYPTAGPFQPKSHEDALDKLTMIAQQLNARITVAFADAFSYKGEWAADKFYNALNVVLYNNSYWMAIDRFTSVTDFDEENWTEVFDLQTVFDAAESAAQSAYEATTSNAAVQVSEDVVVAAEVVVVAAEAVTVAASSTAVAASEIAVDAANAAATILSSANRIDAMAEDVFVASAGQTSFTLANAVDPNNVIVFMNTRKMKYGADQDYLFTTVIDSVTHVVFNAAMVGGEEVEIVTFNTRTSPNASEIWPTLLGGGVVGGVSGLVLSRGGDNTLSVSAGYCRSETNAAWISIADQDVVIPVTVSTTYSVFAMVDGAVRVSTDPTGADLPSLYKRWVGFVVVNSSGVLTDWLSSGDDVWFSDFDDLTCLPALSGTPTTIPLSSLLPVTKIETVTFGANGPTGQSGVVYISASDSSNVVNTLLIESGSTWGSGGDSVPISLAVNAHVSFGSGSLAVHVVKIRR